MNNLKPCPYCGESGVSGTHPELGIHFAGCPDPDCLGFHVAYDFATVEDAENTWNRRAARVIPTKEEIIEAGKLSGLITWKCDDGVYYQVTGDQELTPILQRFAELLVSTSEVLELTNPEILTTVEKHTGKIGMTSNKEDDLCYDLRTLFKGA